MFFTIDVGIVVGGVLSQGRINIRDGKVYHLGPNAKGEFIKVKVISIHRHRMSVNYVHSGQAATLALENTLDPNWKIHKGMVLLETDKPECYTEFEADLMVLYHATSMAKGTCGMINSGSIRQHARVTSIAHSESFEQEMDALSLDDNDPFKKDTLQSGEKGRCTFRFMYEPCYLRIGVQILFMQNGSKCLGRVTRLIPRAQDE